MLVQICNKAIKCILKALLYIFVVVNAQNTYAVEILPNNLVDFTSTTGLVLFQNNINNNALKLLEHFTAQETNSYCGIASAVMILNSLNLPAPIDSSHSPYHYFTQTNFFNEGVTPIITAEEVQRNGINLTKLHQAIQSYGLDSEIFYADNLNFDEFKTLLKNAIVNQKFIIVNFLRKELQQLGGGHYSPLAAYDEKTDRFLLLDVARYKYSSYWVKTDDLWNAVNTKDDEIFRGIILISSMSFKQF